MPHSHLSPDALYPFDARAIAKRFRHGDHGGRSSCPVNGDATPERDAGAPLRCTIAGIPSAGRFPCGGPSARAPGRPIFGALDALRPGETMRFANDHDPLPLLEQLRTRYGEGVEIRYVAREPGNIVIDFLRR